MKQPLLILAALVLLAPLMATQLPARAQSGSAGLVPEIGRSMPVAGFDRFDGGGVSVPDPVVHPDEQNQVRIEQRIVIRISPSPQGERAQSLAELPRRPLKTHYEEVPHSACVAVEDIAAVQPAADNRLLLFTRDRRVLAAELERSCSARAFYSGFYLESNEDGQLCVSRDRLHSRAGARCQLAGLTRLVAVAD